MKKLFSFISSLLVLLIISIGVFSQSVPIKAEESRAIEAKKVVQAIPQIAAFVSDTKFDELFRPPAFNDPAKADAETYKRSFVGSTSTQLQSRLTGNESPPDFDSSYSNQRYGKTPDTYNLKTAYYLLE